MVKTVQFQVQLLHLSESFRFRSWSGTTLQSTLNVTMTFHLAALLALLLAACFVDVLATRPIPPQYIKTAEDSRYGGFPVTTDANLTYQTCDISDTNSIGACSPLGHERARCMALGMLNLPKWETIGVNLSTAKTGVCHCDMVSDRTFMKRLDPRSLRYIPRSTIGTFVLPSIVYHH
jgi:hypothetical protein